MILLQNDCCYKTQSNTICKNDYFFNRWKTIFLCSKTIVIRFLKVQNEWVVFKTIVFGNDRKTKQKTIDQKRLTTLTVLYTYSMCLPFGISYTHSFGSDTRMMFSPPVFYFICPTISVYCKLIYSVEDATIILRVRQGFNARS